MCSGSSKNGLGIPVSIRTEPMSKGERLSALESGQRFEPSPLLQVGMVKRYHGVVMDHVVGVSITPTHNPMGV